MVQACESHTQILLLVAVVATVVLLVANQASVDAVAVVTAELGWHFTCNVDCSKKKRNKKRCQQYFIRRSQTAYCIYPVYLIINTEQTKQTNKEKTHSTKRAVRQTRPHSRRSRRTPSPGSRTDGWRTQTHSEGTSDRQDSV